MAGKTVRIVFGIALAILILSQGRMNAAVPEGFAILADRSGEPDYQIKNAKKDNSKSKNSSWQPLPDDIARCFAVGTVETSEDLNPDWLWQKKIILQQIDLFACPSQYKSCALAIRFLRDVQGLMSVVSDLHAPDGSSISGENIDVRIVQYIRQKNSPDIRAKGHWLEKFFPRNVPANRTLWVWLTFYVPADAQTGLYQGKITIHDKTGASAVLPVRLCVLDFDLQRPGGSWGMYVPGHFYRKSDRHYENYTPGDYWRSDNLVVYFKYWKTRQLNSPTIVHVYPGLKCIDGHAVSDFHDISEFARAMKAAGCDGELCIDLRFIEWWAQSAADKLAELRKAGKPIKGDLGFMARTVKPVGPTSNKPLASFANPSLSFWPRQKKIGRRSCSFRKKKSAIPPSRPPAMNISCPSSKKWWAIAPF